ncbi:MAG: carbohydrate ABC transporter permease [Acidimicrobiales bacterium]
MASTSLDTGTATGGTPGADAPGRDRGRGARGVRRRSIPGPLAGVATYVVAIGVVLVVIVPVLYAVLGGFRTTGQLADRPIDIPRPWVFDNYSEILGSDTFWRQLRNSVIVAAFTMAVVVPCASLAAFVLARFSFVGREAVYALFTLGLLFPLTVAILPLFITLRTLDLINNPLGVALPQAAFAMPTSIIVLRPFFRAIPAELEEAAAIDGCGPFRFFYKVALPMSRPVLATVSVVALVASWNAFLLPLVVLGDPQQWTLPLGVTNFSTQYSSDTARILAFTTLSMMPALVFYVVAERQIVSGLASGALKG